MSFYKNHGKVYLGLSNAEKNIYNVVKSEI